MLNEASEHRCQSLDKAKTIEKRMKNEKTNYTAFIADNGLRWRLF
jgi:hypothetical protein